MTPGIPVTTKGQQTRQRIVDSALLLIRERGVAAVTLDDVQEAAGVGRSQMYHYFDGRDEVILAVVEATIDQVLTGSVEDLADLDSFEPIDRWFARTERACDASGGVGGCPIGSLVSQLVEYDDDARRALVNAFDRWLDPLTAGISGLQARGYVRADADAAVLADFTVAALQGGMLLAQVKRDPARLRHALDGARSVLEAAKA